MVSPLSLNQQQTQDNDKTVSVMGDLFPQPDIRPELLVRLQGKLQTTLEIQQLLEIFLDEAQSSILLNGLGYNHSEAQVQALVGDKSRHSVRYNLQTQNDSMGELVLYRETRFREYELANIEGMLTTLVFPMRNALQYQQALAGAYKDPLTGAGNRAAMERTLLREIELSKRTTSPLSILMLDLDHFKKINDQYGHSIGDKVLKDIVSQIRQATRQTDLCFRYGGEEFLIVLSNTLLDSALIIAERIRKKIESFKLITDAGAIQTTASTGCTVLAPEDDLEQLVNRADQLLYNAKHSGRNQVVG